MSAIKSFNSNSPSGTRLKIPMLRMWFVVYILAAFGAILIQFVFLPKLFDSYHYGEGLIIGTDSCLCHRIAIKKSQEIRLKGWAAFDLSPENQVMAGIASIAYVLISPHPWSLILFNSGLFATSAVLLLAIAEKFTKNRTLALVSSIPFCLFPTSALMYSQINKDAFIITAVLCLLLSWMIICRYYDEPAAMCKAISCFLLLNGAGLCLISLIRPYLLEIYRFLFLILSIIVLVWKFRHNKWRIKSVDFGLDLVCFSLISILLLSSFATNSLKTATTKIAYNSSEPISWEWNKSIPDYIEVKMIRLIKSRKRFYHFYKNAGSNIDQNIDITSANKFFEYIPRAISIAMFSPFPDFWSKNAASEGGMIRRAISKAEMSVIYLLFLFLPASVFFWYPKLELWILLIFCLTISTIYAIAVPNIGALYRLRYSFVMPIVVLAFAGMIELLRKLNRNRHHYKCKIKIP